MVEIIAHWTYSHNGMPNDDKEAFAFPFRRMAQAFGVDKVTILGPREKLDKTQNYVLIEEGGVNIKEFIHPQDAIYVVGPNDDFEQRWLDDVMGVKVSIETNTSLHSDIAMGIVLYDRLIKLKTQQ